MISFQFIYFFSGLLESNISANKPILGCLTRINLALSYYHEMKLVALVK